MLDHEDLDRMAPSVWLEPCLRFADALDTPGGICDACGWLLEDHEAAELAVVTVLPRRPRLRRAS